MQQQLGTSARVLDVQASQPMSADAPQPIVADAQAKRKASTDTEAQPKRQRSMPIPTSAPMSLVIIPQEPTTDEVTEDIPSASSADPPHDILQVASSSQAQEIALKQVNRLTYLILQYSYLPLIDLLVFLSGTRFSEQPIFLCH